MKCFNYHTEKAIPHYLRFELISADLMRSDDRFELISLINLWTNHLFLDLVVYFLNSFIFSLVYRRLIRLFDKKLCSCAIFIFSCIVFDNCIFFCSSYSTIICFVLLSVFYLCIFFYFLFLLFPFIAFIKGCKLFLFWFLFLTFYS